jgi:hypothetical protein
MPYCHGCGRYIGEYSAYHREMPGRGTVHLCHHCNRWSERHPGQTGFPPRNSGLKTEGKRVRTFATIYVISSFGICILGLTLIITTDRLFSGILFIIGAISLCLIGLGMKRFSEK